MKSRTQEEKRLSSKIRNTIFAVNQIRAVAFWESDCVKVKLDIRYI